MDIKLVESSKGEKVSFIIKGTTPAFVNSLRRAIISDVPVMAIHEIEFRKNSSLLYDETIAHRLGLIPLKTDLKSYNLPSKCKCEGKGCASCQVKLTLKVKGPTIVYSGELESNDPAIKPVYPKMPITNLLKNQVLEVEATAILGKGNEHVKWSPGIAYYNQIPSIEIKDGNQHCKKCERFVEECPVELFEYKNNKLSIKKENFYKVNLNEACVGVCDEHVVITATDDYMFFVESFGQLKPVDMILSALRVIQEQVEEFGEVFKGVK